MQPEFPQGVKFSRNEMHTQPPALSLLNTKGPQYCQLENE